jgi:hypothetical protein
VNDHLLLAYWKALGQDEPATLYVEECLFNLSIRYIGGFLSARLSIGQAHTDFLTKIVKHSTLRDRLCRTLNFLGRRIVAATQREATRCREALIA